MSGAPAQATRAPAASAADTQSDSRAGKEKAEALFRLGPVVGMGLPNLFSYGAMVKVTQYFGAGINVGLIPDIKISLYGDATVSYREYDFYARVFPFGGALFVGAGIGYVTIDGTLSATLDTSRYANLVPVSVSLPDYITYESQGSVRTMVLTPQIGYFYTSDIGFSVGIDAGAQLPVASSDTEYRSSLILPDGVPQTVIDEIQSQYVDPTDKKVEATLQTVGRTALPSVNVRVGWLF